MSEHMERVEGSLSTAGISLPSRTKCPLCKELFSDPKILPCLHTFCTGCIQQLEPLSVLGSRGRQSADPRSWLLDQLPLSLLCPVCDSEVNLPPGGVGALTTDHLAINEVLLERMKKEGLGLLCDLCNEGKAERSCNTCRVSLCEFCCQAHRRQKKTASHVMIALKDMKGCNRIVKPVHCSAHPSEELWLFCEVCDRPVCRDCVVGEHREHAYDFTNNVIHKHGDYMRELLKSSEPHVGALEGMLHEIENVSKGIGECVKTVALEVENFAAGYIRAVEQHKDRLLKHLEEVKLQKETALHLQKVQLEQLLADMRMGVDFTEYLLANGSDLEILLTKRVVISRLRRLNKSNYSVHAVMDDSISFYPQEKAGQYHGYEMFGAIVTNSVDPAKCVIQGEGLHTVRQEQEAAFTLLCKNNIGEQVERGGEQIRIRVVHKDRKDCVIEPRVQDNNDGTYQVSFTPPEPGAYTVWARIKGQHVQGSPFTLTVKNKFRKHQGVFHCCTFCSSGGQKDARCACGGTMPGGYQGCGHGHKGHPSRPHWSCCGQTSENSECSGPIELSSPRSLLRTVAI
ncbi:tripartite motif-containing protein 45-like [Microcaecilia unicolor]|uniref:RING-type E3 ubiquitin transferase n=1 Tax=Microcaecilia unicolor TaxID=1415580 RepID=A0A6P7WW45_9AMPH|nr:tripartite motif-containing protein 45-like [Microcaecilia unicolor]